MGKIIMKKVRKVLRDHREEIAQELGIDMATLAASQSVSDVRNANADPGSPMSARTGRVTDKKGLGLT